MISVEECMILSGKNIKNIRPESSEWGTFKLHIFYFLKLFFLNNLSFSFISPCAICISLYLSVHIYNMALYN